jgi:hypothetical protein
VTNHGARSHAIERLRETKDLAASGKKFRTGHSHLRLPQLPKFELDTVDVAEALPHFI